MDLPQTDAGIPAPGIDPTTEELAGINTLAQIFDWLGTAELARVAVCASLGGGTPRLREVFYIKATIGTMQLPRQHPRSRQ